MFAGKPFAFCGGSVLEINMSTTLTVGTSGGGTPQYGYVENQSGSGVTPYGSLASSAYMVNGVDLNAASPGGYELNRISETPGGSTLVGHGSLGGGGHFPAYFTATIGVLCVSDWYLRFNLNGVTFDATQSNCKAFGDPAIGLSAQVGNTLALKAYRVLP